jgi:hypothetical protein
VPRGPAYHVLAEVDSGESKIDVLQDPQAGVPVNINAASGDVTISYTSG